MWEMIAVVVVVIGECCDLTRLRQDVAWMARRLVGTPASSRLMSRLTREEVASRRVETLQVSR